MARTSHKPGGPVGTTDLASTANGKGASLVGVEDAGGLLTATTVEAALAEVVLKKRTLTITHADLTEAGAGVAQSVNLQSVLPTPAIVVAHELNQGALFTGGGALTVVIDVGGTDTDAIVAGDTVGPGGTANQRAGTPGILPQGTFSGQQLKVTFTPDVASNLNDLTAGSITVTVWYF